MSETQTIAEKQDHAWHGRLAREQTTGETPVPRNADAPVDKPAKTPALRLLPDLVAREPIAPRLIGVLLAWVITALFFTAVVRYLWSPAHEGVDQNGYLVGGKLYAHSLSTGLKLDDPLAFVGNMWVYIPKTQTYYPKYPIGLPMLYAAGLRLFGDGPGGLGYVAAHLVSPVLASLGVLGTFFLARQLAGTYAGLIAMLMMATCQYTIPFAYNPNSHAASFGVVTWGMFLLIRFMQTGSLWRGMLAGFVIGFATLIRYTEGLLILPLWLACVMMLRWTEWRSWLRLSLVGVAWLIPVGYQLLYNKVLMGTWTSYGPTNESTGFKLEVMLGDWDRTIHTINDGGLFFVGALGAFGMAVMLFVRTRVGVLLATWVLPSVLLYAAYYWAPAANVSYGRFFYSQFPAIVVAAAWLLCTFVRPPKSDGFRQRAAGTIAIAAVVAIACAIPTMRIARYGDLGDRWITGNASRNNANMCQLGNELVKLIPKGSVVISEANTLHHLQFVGDWTVIDQQMFLYEQVMAQVNRVRRNDAEDPDPIDPGRMEYLKSYYTGKSPQTMRDEFDRVVKPSLASNRRVFLVLGPASWKGFAPAILADRYEQKRWPPFVDSNGPLSEVEKLEDADKPPRPFTGNARGFRGWRARNLASSYEIVELKLKP
ncbi:MAG: glycosyltransferase family 39 protein [Tepidisphaeraceae bacterium]